MSTCEAEHKKCLEHYNKYDSRQKLPSRLLKIEVQNGGAIGVTLVDTSDVKGKYACLSYCWGSNRQASMTTTANREDYRQAIPWQELPSTISDAIKLCCKLGFEYLWVDSLCIVQDDGQDWLREASNMAGIYSRSALTLAVHLCGDASESFLQKRLLDTEQWSDRLDGCATIPFTDRNTGNKREMYLWKDTSFKGSRFLDGQWQTIKDVGRDGPSGKWFSRAWTFQEWFLSPRVLHIHAMTVWDCFGSYGNELERRFLRYRDRFTSRAIDDSQTWNDIVQDYTSRQITLERDRLPALAGLAERFRADFGGTYLAGLWLEDLPQTLLWTRSSGTCVRRPLTYRAPTWSWAALEGEVYFQDFRDHYGRRLSTKSTIVGHYCQYDPPETFATVADGWLDVWGFMRTVGGWTLNEDDSWVSGSRLYTHDRDTGTRDEHSWSANLDLGRSIEKEIRRSEVYLLELMAEEAKVGSNDDPKSYALVLKIARRHEMGQDCFQRLGVARSFSPTSSSSTSLTKHWAGREIRLI